jgi:hypothetical protein
VELFGRMVVDRMRVSEAGAIVDFHTDTFHVKAHWLVDVGLLPFAW